MSDATPLTMTPDREHTIRVQYDSHEQSGWRGPVTCAVCDLLKELDATRAQLPPSLAPRRIAQICCTNETDSMGWLRPVLFALADDGTLWEHSLGAGWRQMRDLPAGAPRSEGGR